MQGSNMDNKMVAAHFKLLADLMELHGEAGFKSGAYHNAYRILKNFDIPLETLNTKELEDIPGIGKAIAGKIIELVHQNSFPLLEKYLALTPPGVVEMLQLKGIGPKKIALLWKELGVESIGELYYACTENRLTAISGFGEKTQENILQQLLFLQQSKGQLLYAQAEPVILEILSVLKNKFPNHFIEQTGEVRRKNNTVSVLDIITDLPEKEIQTITEFITLLPGSNKLAYKHESGIAVQFHLTNSENAVMDWFQTTGTEEHTEKILTKVGHIKGFPSEESLYLSAGFPYMPPEVRENKNEWSWVVSNEKLITTADIKGILHAHSTYSDGASSLKEMSIYAKDNGFEYLGISDHSQSAFYANGLKESDILRQHAEIDALNQSLSPFIIYKGIESDILNDGRLDYPEEILKTFDFVIASVHSNLKMDMEKATRRLISAIENPFTTMLGHATGRLLLSRPGYPIDHEKIIDACAANGVVIELNANPYRLDIDWSWIPRCIEKGVKIAVNPDAHHLKGILDIRYGVISARKACLTPSHCLNTLGAIEIGTFFKAKKSAF